MRLFDRYICAVLFVKIPRGEDWISIVIVSSLGLFMTMLIVRYTYNNLKEVHLDEDDDGIEDHTEYHQHILKIK